MHDGEGLTEHFTMKLDYLHENYDSSNGRELQ